MGLLAKMRHSKRRADPPSQTAQNPSNDTNNNQRQEQKVTHNDHTQPPLPPQPPPQQQQTDGGTSGTSGGASGTSGGASGTTGVYQTTPLNHPLTTTPHTPLSSPLSLSAPPAGPSQPSAETPLGGHRHARLLERTRAQDAASDDIASLEDARAAESALEAQRAATDAAIAELRAAVGSEQPAAPHSEAAAALAAALDDARLEIAVLQGRLRQVRSAVAELPQDDWLRDISRYCLAPLYVSHERHLAALKSRQAQIGAWLGDARLADAKERLRSVGDSCASEAEVHSARAVRARAALSRSPSAAAVVTAARRERAARHAAAEAELQAELELELAARDERLERLRADIRRLRFDGSSASLAAEALAQRPVNLDELVDAFESRHPQMATLIRELVAPWDGTPPSPSRMAPARPADASASLSPLRMLSGASGAELSQRGGRMSARESYVLAEASYRSVVASPG